jgi:NAD(P)-dependent dehydrogenase (short-subunit alcohol dehydrogenase family)
LVKNGRMSSSRTVLITGCSSGIGQATALRLARAGFITYATARNVDALGDLRTAGCRTLPLDVTDDTSMQTAVAAVELEHGSLFALVNNAGYSQSGALATLPMDKLRAQFETNIFGLVRLTQLVIPGMRRAGAGRIVNISSMGGRLSFPGAGAYHATKHALEALSDVLRFELHAAGISVIVIQPGAIRTGYAERVMREMPVAAPETADPFAPFNAAVAAGTKSAYEKGPLRTLGGDADAVARTIETALTAPRPRTRYRVTPSAHLMMTLRSLLPDRLWDGFIRGQYGAVARTLPGRIR